MPGRPGGTRPPEGSRCRARRSGAVDDSSRHYLITRLVSERVSLGSSLSPSAASARLAVALAACLAGALAEAERRSGGRNVQLLPVTIPQFAQQTVILRRMRRSCRRTKATRIERNAICPPRRHAKGSPGFRLPVSDRFLAGDGRPRHGGGAVGGAGA